MNILQQEITKLWGKWEIDELLGEGSFGKVYRIEKEDFNHVYKAALKVITIPKNEMEIRSVFNDGMDEKSTAMYFRSFVEDIVDEIELMSKVKGNTNIVSYEDHAVVPREGKIGWNIYIRMELLTPLFDYLQNNQFSIRDVIKLGIDICSALEICQRYNIIHRDIKPENIFVSDIGKFKLGDFGIARQLEKTTSGLSKKGTYTYMAPEVYKGEEYNSTVDIYSLGIVLYRFLNDNRTPFLPSSPNPIKPTDKEHATVMRMSGVQIPKPCNAEGRLVEVVLKACAYDPKERYESASEMKKALEEILYEEDETKLIYPMGDKLNNLEPEYIFTNNPQNEISSDEDDNKNVVLEDIQKEEDRTVAIFGYDSDIKFNISRKNEKSVIEEIKVEDKNDYIQEDAEVADNSLKEKIENVTADTKDGKFLNKNKKIKKIIIIVILCLIVGSIIGVIKNSINNPPNSTNSNAGIQNNSDNEKKAIPQDTEVPVVSVAVPNVVGMSQQQAMEMMQALDFSFNIASEQYSDNIEKGVVISQDIQPDTMVPEQTVVSVVISAGVEKVTVPNVKGKTKKAAQKKLKKLNLKCTIEKEYSNTVAANVVISQSIKAGKKVNKNSKVKLVVSLGKKDVQKPSNKKPSKNNSSRNDSWVLIN